MVLVLETSWEKVEGAIGVSFFMWDLGRTIGLRDTGQS